MKVIVHIKKKYNPLYKAALEKTNTSLFGELNKVFDTKVNLSLDEEIGEQYIEFVTLTGIINVTPLGDLQKVLNILKVELKEKFKIPDFLISILEDD